MMKNNTVNHQSANKPKIMIVNLIRVPADTTLIIIKYYLN